MCEGPHLCLIALTVGVQIKACSAGNHTSLSSDTFELLGQFILKLLLIEEKQYCA
jgi:hypothetical protein